MGNRSSQIKAELDAVYENSAPSFATVKFWVAEFKCGRTSLVDKEPLKQSKTAITAKTSKKFTKWCWTIVELR